MYNTKRITLMGILLALMIATIAITIPMYPAPITLQTMFVILFGLILGKRDGTILVLIYLLMGAIGLPVFYGFKGGIQELLNHTAGYKFAFIPASFLSGILRDISLKNEFSNKIDFIFLFVGVFIIELMILFMGAIGLYLFLDSMGFIESLLYQLIFIPGGIIKCLLASLLYFRLKNSELLELN